MMYNIKVQCRRDGMADVTDSKSVGGNTVWVQVPPPAPKNSTDIVGAVLAKYSFLYDERQLKGENQI